MSFQVVFFVCSLLTELLVFTKYKYSMSSILIEMFSQTSLFFFFYFLLKLYVIRPWRKRRKHFVGQVDSLFCLFSEGWNTSSTPKYSTNVEIYYLLPAVDVFLRNLSNNSFFFFNLIIFSKNIFFSKRFPVVFPVLHRDMEHAWQSIRSGVVFHVCYKGLYPRIPDHSGMPCANWRTGLLFTKWEVGWNFIAFPLLSLLWTLAKLFISFEHWSQ